MLWEAICMSTISWNQEKIHEFLLGKNIYSGYTSWWHLGKNQPSGDENASAILLSSAFYHSSPKNVGVSTFSTDLLQVLPMNNEVALTSKFVVMAMAKELEGFYFKTTQSFPANSSQNILTIYLQ